ncbi:AzlC family ABC transporter permease [Kitasatospora atroaurantiaca]|uniref:4-azaleucine resistance transporter AzlC n=1 Tax=Kitasatospora atroaurantiaca TaxID=285545 RepID=A0A561EIN4_9ACTN|nr:AzlC family ABC transporter permease [Kitasatospora atroaurantiaca]TWE15475.1 4-azaleucine resistance transporter AzlC [Kitasatospora atroaurantiaca]
MRIVTPAALGALPMGLAFGVVVSQSPLAWWWAPVFATVIFAGSLEFVVLGMVVAVAPLAQIAATAFLVNFRHVFYALSFPLHRVHGRGAKVYSTFTLTDEAWALTTGPQAQRWSRRRILTIQAALQVVWVAAVTVGALAGTFLPDSVVGLDFAVTAFFLVLTIDAFRVRRSVPLPVIALLCALGSYLLFGDGMLVAAMTAFVAILLTQYALTCIKRRSAHA